MEDKLLAPGHIGGHIGVVAAFSVRHAPPNSEAGR